MIRFTHNRIWLAVVVAGLAALIELRPDVDGLTSDRVEISTVALPPPGPDLGEMSPSTSPAHDVLRVEVPFVARTPFVDNLAAQQLPVRRKYHLAAMEMNNGRDADWMTYAAGHAAM